MEVLMIENRVALKFFYRIMRLCMRNSDLPVNDCASSVQLNKGGVDKVIEITALVHFKSTHGSNLK